MKRLILISLCVVLAWGTAVADWELTDPAKWVQLPDLGPTGMDVYATYPKVLADDFQCTEPEPITDIHIWGSWLWDYLPMEPTGINPSASNVTFTLSIHSDIPAGAPGGPEYSMPGELLWEHTFGLGQFSVNLYSIGPEGWYNPNTGVYIAESDSQAWQYNFYIDPIEAFQQEGTPDTPIVYWLDVSATPLDEEAWFGWKASLEHWNDDAVWGDSHQGPWNELRYPDLHPFVGESIDLAFVITPEPATVFLLGLGALFLRRRKR